MSLAPSEFDYLRRLVMEGSAIVLEAGKEYLVESRLLPLARREGFETLTALIALLKSEPSNGLHRRVVEAMTTNETLFFRDLHPFEVFRTVALPEPIASRASERRINILCAPLLKRPGALQPCPVEPSNPATVWSNGATDGGSRDPNRIELPVVARHPRNRSQERHRRARCLKNPVPEAARTGLQDFWMGSSEPMTPVEEKIEHRWTLMKVYFPLTRAKKLIPDKVSSQTLTEGINERSRSHCRPRSRSKTPYYKTRNIGDLS